MSASRQLKDYPDVLTVTQVAEILGIGRKQTYRALRARKLPGDRFGARWVVSRYKLAAFLGAPAEALFAANTEADAG